MLGRIICSYKIIILKNKLRGILMLTFGRVIVVNVFLISATL